MTTIDLTLHQARRARAILRARARSLSPNKDLRVFQKLGGLSFRPASKVSDVHGFFKHSSWLSTFRRTQIVSPSACSY
jgi:hypothetical protein